VKYEVIVIRLKSKHKKFIKQIIPFIMVMMLYSALVVPIGGFMAAYLSSRGVDTTFIGTILSISNILGFKGIKNNCSKLCGIRRDRS